MKKRLLLLPIIACTLGACSSAPSPSPSPTPTPTPVEKILLSIKVETKPTKVSYYEGETFDPTGMVVKAVYSDGSEEVITNYQISNQALTVNTTKVTISYSGKTVDVSITVLPLPRYTITFMKDETEKIKDEVYKEGEIPSCDYSVPSTAEFEYQFLGWSLTPNGDVLSALPKVTQNATYYAIILRKTRKYAVIFNDFNGNVIDSKELEYGSSVTAPTYEPEDTQQYDYELLGWSLTKGGKLVESFPNVTGPQTYYAVVSAEDKFYSISFFDEKGTQIQSNLVKYGLTPECDYEVEDTAEWDYTTKWSLTSGGTPLVSLPSVTKDANYYAVISKVKQKYNITFKNEDGSAYKTVSTEYGVKPSVTNPTKAADQASTYSFNGWATTKGGTPLAELPVVTGAATYYATFKATPKQYTITLNMNYSGAVNESITANYGTSYEDFDDYVPEREGYHFAGWCSDQACQNKIAFPVSLQSNVTYYAKWNEKIDFKKYLTALLGIKDYDPYSYVPETLRANYEDNYVQSSDILDYSTSKSVSSIKTEGFGEQWQMVIDNISQSEKFYKVLSASDSIFSAALASFISFFESNPDAKEKEETTATYVASCNYKDGVISFSLEFIKSVLGFTPKVDMTYVVSSAEKTIRIYLNDNNILKCSFGKNSYIFGISYGLTIAGKTGLRTAYCQLEKIVDEDDEENVSYAGHIYEYFSYINDESQKTLVKSSADFYIDDTYCSVIGNKSSGLLGFAGQINELYDVGSGKLIGYEVEETIEKTIKFIISYTFTLTYHTFFFNLADINNVNSVKAIGNGQIDPSNNKHDIYLNGSTNIFDVAMNVDPIVGKVKTSRKYDVEMRDHYYYTDDGEGNPVKNETQVPMMFIQDDDVYYDNEHNNTDFSSFPTDMNSVSGISGAYVKVSESNLNKFRYDCITLGAIYKQNKEAVTPEAIIEWLK